MKFNQDNIKSVKISDLFDYKIKIMSESNRRVSNKLFNGQPNCSGFNINKLIKNGMTVEQYQAVIRNNFSPNDPQFSLSKHLRYDILQGHIELVEDKTVSY